MDFKAVLPQWNVNVSSNIATPVDTRKYKVQSLISTRMILTQSLMLPGYSEEDSVDIRLRTSIRNV